MNQSPQRPVYTAMPSATFGTTQGGAMQPSGTHSQPRRTSRPSYQYPEHKRRGKAPVQSERTQRPSSQNKRKSQVVPPPEEGVYRIIPLGGVEEVGKNLTAIETKDDIIVIDAGMQFSGGDTPGIDYIIPNTTYLEERKDKIRDNVYYARPPRSHRRRTTRTFPHWQPACLFTQTFCTLDEKTSGRISASSRA